MNPTPTPPWNRPRFVALVVVALILSIWGMTSSSGAKPDATPAPAVSKVIEVAGRTECPPKKRAMITPVPLHPVEVVHVAVGDRVKKEQPLVELDADEQKAVVRAKTAALENAEVMFKEAKRYHEAVEDHARSLPAQKCFDARAAALKAEADVRAAKAMLEAEKAELEHYTVVAPIDGVVNRLDVYPGTVVRPGTVVWGEILDLSEIDVRAELKPDEADRIAVGQSAEVRSKAKNELYGTGKVIFISFAADPKTNLVPVIVRMPNPQWRLRAEVPVTVRFTEAKE
jgi:RND family efflux transporter MFP subunit